MSNISDAINSISAADDKIISDMEKHGGSFVRQLAVLLRMADGLNYAKLKVTFFNYFYQYTDFPEHQGFTVVERVTEEDLNGLLESLSREAL